MADAGYPINLEDRRWLDANLEPESAMMAACRGFGEATFDPRQVIKVENQGRLGSCAGHSLSSVMEWCYTIATGSTGLQLSRAMAYFEAQRISGISGDRGSTIQAGVKLATETGLCEEPLWPYPSSYQPARPSKWDGVLENAGKHKVQTATRITSYEGFRTFVGSGQGGVHTGIRWGNGMNSRVIESFRPGGGGHSICGLCLSDRKDAAGEPYIWIMNSWSKSFGTDGWQEWSPTAIRQMLRDSFTVFVGLSDMSTPEPRVYNLDDWKRELRG